MTDKMLGLLPVFGCLFLLIALSGCAGRTHIETIKPQLNIPVQMYQCEDPVARPSGKGIKESEVARYLSSLEFSNKDCKTKLKEIAIIVKCYNEKDCNVSKLIEYLGLVDDKKLR